MTIVLHASGEVKSVLEVIRLAAIMQGEKTLADLAPEDDSALTERFRQERIRELSNETAREWQENGRRMRNANEEVYSTQDRHDTVVGG